MGAEDLSYVLSLVSGAIGFLGVSMACRIDTKCSLPVASSQTRPRLKENSHEDFGICIA